MCWENHLLKYLVGEETEGFCQSTSASLFVETTLCSKHLVTKASLTASELPLEVSEAEVLQNLTQTHLCE